MIRITTNKGKTNTRTPEQGWRYYSNGILGFGVPQVGDLTPVSCKGTCTNQISTCPNIHELQVVVKVEEI